MKKYIIPIIIILVIGVFAYTKAQSLFEKQAQETLKKISELVTLLVQEQQEKEPILGGFTDRSCNASSTLTNLIPIGSDVKTLLMATTSNRAFAQLTRSALATSTFFWIHFTAQESQGNATNTAQMILSTTTPTIEFGLNTRFPYTGAVYGTSPLGSSTIIVTQCNY